MSAPSALKIIVSGDRDIVMTRTFDAPRAMVFNAWTKPDLLKRWLTGPPQWELSVCEIDLRVGGSFRYVWRNKDSGNEMGMGGVYREIVVPERIVGTERFDQPWYPGEAVGTITFAEKAGKTYLTQSLRYESREVRDEVLKSPMESGVSTSYNQLADLLASGRVS